MPLLIEIKSGDKLIINGAVIENAGPSSKLLVHNKATILREKEVLTENIAQTPASRVYYALQCAYIFPNDRDKHLKEFASYLADYVKACPSATEIADKVKKEVDAGQDYKALKRAQELIQHESALAAQLLQQSEALEQQLSQEPTEENPTPPQD